MEVAHGAIFDCEVVMIANGRDKLPSIDPDIVVEALNRGVRQEMKIHKALGNPIAIGRDGKVVCIPTDQSQIPDDNSPTNPATPTAH
jgi:hypothetical protein